MALVDVDNLSFSYDGASRTLTNINLTMEKGQSLLIVGDNGSGKTTFGRLLSGLLSPTSGRVSVAGTEPRAVEASRRCRLVSYMGQVGHLSVLTSSIASEMRSFAHGRQDNSVQDAYEGWARRYSLPMDTSVNPRDLTTPELWRLVLGLYVAVLQPVLLVVDEVFCPGDALQRQCICDSLQRRKEQKYATICLYQRALSVQFDIITSINNDGRLLFQQT